MKWPADDILPDLEEMGTPVTIDGVATHAIIKTKQVISDGVGGRIVEDPYARIATSDVDLMLIEGGEGGSQLVDVEGEVYYQVLSIMDEGTGFSILRLEVV